MTSSGSPASTKKPSGRRDQTGSAGCGCPNRALSYWLIWWAYHGAGTRIATAATTATTPSSGRRSPWPRHRRDYENQEHDAKRPQRPGPDELSEAEHEPERHRHTEPVVGAYEEPTPRGRAPPSRAASTAARDGTSPPTSSPPGRRRRTRLPRDGGPPAPARASVRGASSRSRVPTAASALRTCPTCSGWSRPSRLPSSIPSPPTAKKPGGV